jgi:hypothetical protein
MKRISPSFDKCGGYNGRALYQVLPAPEFFLQMPHLPDGSIINKFDSGLNELGASPNI